MDPLLGTGGLLLLPLSGVGAATLHALARRAEGAEMRPSPFCHEERGTTEVRGWVLDLPCDAPASALPLPPNLFHGVSVVQCDVSEGEALALMQHGAATRRRLAAAVKRFCAAPPAAAQAPQTATWKRCRPAGVPASLHHARRERDGQVVFGVDEDARQILDGAPWAAELSPDGFVGLYFQWLDGRLQLFAACQSYLRAACAEFAGMVHRAGEGCTAGFVCLSEEAQWLRAACARNRARILAAVCGELGIRVPYVDDYGAYVVGASGASGSSSETAACGGGGGGAPRVAIVTTETLHHDLLPRSGGGVRLFNYCCSAGGALCAQGSVCVMAPWQGLWHFRGGLGAARGSAVLPTATPRLSERVRGLSFAARPTTTRSVVVRVGTHSRHHDEDDEDDDEDAAERRRVDAQLQQLVLVAGGAAGALGSGGGGGAATDEALALAAYRRALALTPPSTLTATVDLARGAREHYLVFDETVLQHMVGLGWSRAQGVSQLVPLGVVACGARASLGAV